MNVDKLWIREEKKDFELIEHAKVEYNYKCIRLEKEMKLMEEEMKVMKEEKKEEYKETVKKYKEAVKKYNEDVKKFTNDAEAWQPGVISSRYLDNGQYRYSVKDRHLDVLPWKILIPADAILLFIATSFSQLLLFGVAVPAVAFIVGVGQSVLLYILKTYKFYEFVLLIRLNRS